MTENAPEPTAPLPSGYAAPPLPAAPRRDPERRVSWHVWVALAVFMTASLSATAIGAYVDDPPLWQGIALAVVVAISFGYILVEREIKSRRRESVERLVHTEASALAFWIVILAALVTHSLRGWFDVEQVSPITVVIFGILVFSVLQLLRSLKLGLRI